MMRDKMAVKSIVHRSANRMSGPTAGFVGLLMNSTASQRIDVGPNNLKFQLKVNKHRYCPI